MNCPHFDVICEFVAFIAQPSNTCKVRGRIIVRSKHASMFTGTEQYVRKPASVS